jgi:hypothetical protein
MQNDYSSPAKIFKSLVGKTQNIVEIPLEQNMSKYVLDKEDDFPIGATFNLKNSSITGWFYEEYLHSLPLTLNLIYQSIIKDKLGADFGTVVTIDPHSTTLEGFTDYKSIRFRSEILIFLAMFITAFWINKLIEFHVKEQTTGVKAMYIANGLERWKYYLSYILFEAISLFVLASAFTIIFTLVSNPKRLYKEYFVDVLPTLLIYLIPAYFYCTTHLYFISMFIKKAFNAKVALIAFYIVTGK